MTRRPGRLLWALAVTAGLLLSGGPPGAAALSGHASLDSSGLLTVQLTGTDANGSALRYAMDGNFTPLVQAFVTDPTQQASILGQIASLEQNILLGALFGNRDGTVSGTEVTTFQSLLTQESQLLPSTGLTGTSFLGLTMDGQAAATAHLGAITFTDATGADTSSAPIDVNVTLTYQFGPAGGSHTLAFTINLTSAVLTIGTGVPVGLSVTLPAATTITSTSGFASASVSNDPLGWGTASMSGSFLPSTATHLSVGFGPAFPLGTVLAVTLPIAAVAALAGLWLLRRRRRRRRVVQEVGASGSA